ncbi:hypothetical protein ACUOCP_54810, partial [Escherichia sp. R-CC3]
LQVAALGMLNRQRVSANGFLSPYAMDAPALGMDGPYYTEATVGLFAGLDLDLWGVHRSAIALLLRFLPARHYARQWRRQPL